MEDEYKSYGRETNKPIAEFQQFDAVEYYASEEYAPQSNGNPDVPESSVDNLTNNNSQVSDNSSDKEAGQNDYNRDDSFNNKADGQKSPDMNAQNETGANVDSSAANAASDSSAAAIEEAGAATASTVGASSTVASLAGSFTVVAAAAVAAAVVGGSIANKAPTLVSEYYESGTNYLTFEIDLAELTEGTEYKVRVSNANFIMEYPISEGYTRQLVTGLTPYRRYDVDIIGVAEELGDVVYYSHPVYTNKEPKPKAVFDFIPNFDIQRGLIDIEYVTYISDFYHTGSDTYFQVSVNGKLVVDDHDLDDESYFRGEIKGLSDLSFFEAVAYTTYYGEVTEIGRTGYSPEYPEEFHNNTYNAVYSIQEPKVSFGTEGFNLSIDTGFETTDPRDSYIIDIYKAGAVVNTSNSEGVVTGLDALNDDLIASYEGNTKTFEITIPGTTDDIDVYFTGVKTIGDTPKKFETKKIYSYSFAEIRKTAPEPVADVEFIEDFDPVDEVYNVDYVVDISDIFKTGSDYVVKELIENEVVKEINLEGVKYTGSFKNIYNGANIAVIVYSKYNEEEEIIVIGSGEKKVEHPEPFKDIEFSLYDGGYYVEMTYVNAESTKEFTVKIIEHDVDGTDNVVTETFVGRLSHEGGFEGKKTLADVQSFDVQVLYGEKTIFEFTVGKNDSSIEIGDVDADEDGNILIPYEFKLPTGATFSEGGFNFESGAQEYYTVEEASGNIVITELTANLIEGGRADISYIMPNGVKVSTSFAIDDIDLAAQYTLDYYAHCNSAYNSLYIRYATKINDKRVNSGLSPVIILGESETYPREMDGEYYKVEVASDLSTGYGTCKFKLANPGFSDEVTTVNIVAHIADESYSAYEAALGNYEVSVDSEQRIRYFATNNEDGTVNYYFNPQFNDKSTNKHYYRIEYSYKDEYGVTHYDYSEFLNSATYSMLNMPNREYTFKFKTYYVSNAGLYYDHKFNSSDTERDCVLVNSDTVIYDYNIGLFKNNFTEANDAVVHFKLDYNNLIKDEPITLSYGGKSYTIAYKSSDDPETDAIPDDPNGYAYFGEDDDYRYRVYVYDSFGDASYINVEFAVKNVTGTTPGTATVTYTSIPNTVLDNYSGIDKNDYKETVTKTIGGYTATYDLENATMTTSDSWYSNQITINNLNFKATDSQDSLMAVAYFNGNKVGEAYYDSYYKEIEFNDINPAYTNVVVKFYEVKRQTVNILDTDYYTYNEDVYTLEYSTTPVYEKEFSLREMNIVTGLDVALEGVSYVITASDFDSNYTPSDYELQVYGYDKNGTMIVEGNDSATNSVYLSYEAISEIDRIEVFVILSGYDIKAQSIIINKPSIGEYEYDDLNNRLIVPFDVSLPDGATLQSGSQVTYIEDQIDINDGHVIIDELESNVITFTFDYSYVKENGLTVSIRDVTVTKELHGDLDFSYDIYSVLADSSYGSFSIKQDIKYDVDSETVYYYKNGSYYDENGNEAPSTAVNTTYNNTIYYLKGTVTEKIGKYTFPTTLYTVNVVKSGGSVINPTTGELNENTDVEANVSQAPFTLSGEEIPSVYLTFLHTTLGTAYSNAVHGINKCELEFEILSGDTVVISKKIEFTEPGINSIPDSSAFTIDRASVNNTVTKNQNGTINVVINTGFDSSTYPNYGYKIYLNKKTDYFGYDSELVYQSEVISTNTITIENLENTNYEVGLEVFYLQDGIYVPVTTSNSSNEISCGRINSPIEDTDWVGSQADGFNNILYIDTGYINPDYLDGTKQMSFKTGSIDLSTLNTDQTVASCTVTVTNEGNGIYKINIFNATNSSTVRGNLVIEQGNATTGYTEITYSI